MSTSRRLGILAGGGPAPGINAVISAATIEAINEGFEVVGIPDGFKHLIRRDLTTLRPLGIGDVSRVHLLGGSILGTSRENPAKSAEATRAVIETLQQAGITHLLTIGGDDTALSSWTIAEGSAGAIRTVHVPKTIDNDLPLPPHVPTFGFQTARHQGVELVRNLMEDSRSTRRWYVVVAMGRQAGHLALGIGKAAGATLTVIAEEFASQYVPFATLCDIVEGAIVKRQAMGRPFGVAVLAEGLIGKLDPAELAGLQDVERDEAGRDLGFVLVFEDLTDLIKAQKAAAWQEVAQRIAHEIKNPLTPIQLSAQRLRKKYFEQAPDFDRIFDEGTQVIVNEVGSLKNMVDEFSKFARMPAPQMAEGSLHDVLREVIALYQGAHKDVEFLADFDEVLPSLRFDREQIKRVLVNLFNNGIQAMNQKGRLWVTTRYDGKRRRAVVSVADEGSGISPEDHEKLFMPYFSRKRTGTGLGLAISRRIITDHEGQISAANNQPRGTVFTFELPV